MQTHTLSRHALKRANQRGVTHTLLSALLLHADQETPVGGGCAALRLSRGRLADRSLRSALGAEFDRLDGLVAIVGDDGGVVTLLRDHNGRAGRRYRRPQ